MFQMEYTCVANSRAYFKETSLNARHTHFAMAPVNSITVKPLSTPYLYACEEENRYYHIIC